MGGGQRGRAGEGDGGCNNGSLVLADREIVICPCVTIFVRRIVHIPMF